MSYNPSVGLSGIFHSSLTTEVSNKFLFLTIHSACLACVSLVDFFIDHNFGVNISEPLIV